VEHHDLTERIEPAAGAFAGDVSDHGVDLDYGFGCHFRLRSLVSGGSANVKIVYRIMPW
jgi:hypothetical protein